eukprot:Lankesteria_metandrocarpae@DN2050_c0_g1_i1.p1
MGIDLSDKRKGPRNGRRTLKSPNPYLELLTELYGFLSRRTDSKFNRLVAKRLIKARKFRGPLSMSALCAHMTGKEQQTAVVVGSILDDKFVHKVPAKLRVCALRFSQLARNRIVNAGGECMTFDQLALRAPLGSGCVLLRSPSKRREVEKHFGRPAGVPHSKAMPYAAKNGKGRHKEKRRGCRNGS